MKENISGRYRIAQILDEGFLLLFTAASYGCIETDESRYTVQIYVFSVRGEYVIIKNQSTKIDIFCYCSLVISREVFLRGEYVIIKNQSTKIDIFYHHNNKRK